MKQAILIAGAALVAFASPAVAGPGHGKGHGNAYAFGGQPGCPPGLAKKNNGCLPPGQAKKLYNLGQRLPMGFDGYTPYNQIPYDLRRQYDLDPYGRYIYDQSYIYRVDPTTQIVRSIINAIIR